MESEWYALFALALTTGMRPSEYLALKWSDFDWHRGTASVCRTIQTSSAAWAFYDTKRKRSRRAVKLQNFVLEALDDPGDKCEREHDLVFHTSGQPLRQRKIKIEFRRLLAAAGIRSIRLYDLRHTAATLAVDGFHTQNSRATPRTDPHSHRAIRASAVEYAEQTISASCDKLVGPLPDLLDGSDLTWLFCTSRTERLEDRKEPGNAEENICSGADRDQAAAD